MMANPAPYAGGKDVPKMVGPRVISAAKTRLKGLPEKPKEPKAVPLSEAIRQIKSEVQAALKRGYTFDEITQALKEDGIDIGTPTLKSYMYRGARRRTPKAAPTAATATPKERAGTRPVEMPTEL